LALTLTDEDDWPNIAAAQREAAKWTVRRTRQTAVTHRVQSQGPKVIPYHSELTLRRRPSIRIPGSNHLPNVLFAYLFYPRSPITVVKGKSAGALAMAAEAEDDPKPTVEGPVTPRRKTIESLPSNQDEGQDNDVVGETSDEGEDEEEDADGAEEEPQLKYHRLTPNLSSVYRSGDATSCFLVSGDKMVFL
jgi:hypothetical protein